MGVWQIVIYSSVDYQNKRVSVDDFVALRADVTLCDLQGIKIQALTAVFSCHYTVFSSLLRQAAKTKTKTKPEMRPTQINIYQHSSKSLHQSTFL